MKRQIGEVFKDCTSPGAEERLIMTIDSPTGHRLELYQRIDCRLSGTEDVHSYAIKKFMEEEQEWLRLQGETQ